MQTKDFIRQEKAVVHENGLIFENLGAGKIYTEFRVTGNPSLQSLPLVTIPAKFAGVRFSAQIKISHQFMKESYCDDIINFLTERWKQQAISVIRRETKGKDNAQ